MNDSFYVGPYRISEFHMQRLELLPGTRVEFGSSLEDLLHARITVRSADLRVKAVTDSQVDVPRLGLEGNGHYTLELKGLTIRNNLIRARVLGSLVLYAGPLQVSAQIDADGSGPIDDRIDLSRLGEHLSRTAHRARAEFTVRAKVNLGPVTGKITGRGEMTTRSFSSTGEFVFGLPPLLYARGAYQFDHTQGLRARGWSAGLLIPGLNDLGLSQSGPIALLKPGVIQFGVSLFDLNLSSGMRTILTLGVSPTSSIPSPNGNMLPFAGSNEGFYSGFALKLRFF